MRVALVCPYSWSVPGGVQAHVAGLAGALRELGHDVDVLAPADSPVRDVLPLGRSLPIPSNGSIQRVALSPVAVRRTARHVRRGGYDVVHLHEPMLPAACLAAIATARSPLVATFHMFREELLWYRVFAPVVRAAARRLAVRIAVSEAARRYATRALGGEVRVIPNGIDWDGLAALPPERRGGRILFVGRPEPRKGLPVLLDAFRRVGDGAELVLAGPSGDYGGGVTARGRLGDADLRGELARADVLCAPSLGGESFGLVLAEAMAAGVPVVASRIDGYTEVLDGRAGRFVPPADPAALAAALAELLGDDTLCAELGRHGREAARRFAWPAVAAEVVGAYEDAEARGRTPSLG